MSRAKTRIAPTVLSIAEERARWDARARVIDFVCSMFIAAGIAFMIASTI